MKELIGRFLFFLIGWEIENKIPKDLKKYVLIAAPHTSNVDFLIALPSMWQIHLKGKYLIKKELFWWPLSWFLRVTGGVPVNRSSMNKEFVEYLKALLNDNEEFAILFTPEGTRSYTTKWKTGFYRIAQSLDLPIVLAYADFKKKKVKVGDVFYPTNDLKGDLEQLEEYFKSVTAKHPEQFNKRFYKR